jgi:dTDP-4-dehydrorhamnose reductase
MTVLITGTQGFIGSKLLEYLNSKNWQVHGLIANLTKRDEVFMEVKEVKPDVVVHFGAVMGTPKCERADWYSFDVNVKGTWNIASAAKNIGADFVYVGSSACYKPDSHVIDETSIVQPLTLYPFTKYLGEQVTKFVFGEDCMIARLVFVFGPHDGHSGIWTIINAALKREPAFLLMDPDALKDYIYIDNVSNAFELALTKNLKGLYNISYGAARYLKGVVAITLEKLEKFEIAPPLDIVYRPDLDYMRSHRVDNSKFIKATGWLPKIDLNDGIENTVFEMLEEKMHDVKGH